MRSTSWSSSRARSGYRFSLTQAGRICIAGHRRTSRSTSASSSHTTTSPREDFESDAAWAPYKDKGAATLHGGLRHRHEAAHHADEPRPVRDLPALPLGRLASTFLVRDGNTHKETVVRDRLRHPRDLAANPF